MTGREWNPLSHNAPTRARDDTDYKALIVKASDTA
jgi:hypothetical protein